VSVRLIRGPGDLGVGYVWGRDDRPWGPGAGALERTSAFAKGEYSLYPWLIASLRASGSAFARRPDGTYAAAVYPDSSSGLIALIRQRPRRRRGGSLST
jgi:hypothetical protein